MSRRGFALVAVLWLLAAAGSVVLVGSLAAREAVRAAHNRISLLRARWIAEGCAAEARARLDAALQAGSSWSAIGAAAPSETDVCSVGAHPAGVRVDLNSAGGDQLARLLHLVQVAPERADSLLQALLDWRDADREPRPGGAERAWYTRQGLFPPRDGPLADARELKRVRGFESLDALDSLVGVEPGRIALAAAPLTVIASLPGMTPETLQRLREVRSRRQAPASWTDVAATLSRESQDSLGRHLSELAALATWDPDAWILTARSPPAGDSLVAMVELRLAHAGSRAAVVRVREW